MLTLGPLLGVHAETALAAGYAVMLLLIALGIERMAHRSHRRAERYETGGFVYASHLDAWECPTGQQLHPTEIDHVRRLTRYRARAEACNRCFLKSACTDSADGREIIRAHDPWLESEVGRFHRGLSLVLVALAGLIASLALVGHHDDADVLVLVPPILLIVVGVRRRLRGLRRSRPAPVPVLPVR